MRLEGRSPKPSSSRSRQWRYTSARHRTQAVGQVAQRSGVAPSALRFYERQGLITSDRTAGNQRRYHGDVLCRVAMIRACQRVGLSIAEIRTALAELPEGHIPGPADWDRLARRLRHELHHRIDDLNRALQALSQHDPRQQSG